MILVYLVDLVWIKSHSSDNIVRCASFFTMEFFYEVCDKVIGEFWWIPRVRIVLFFIYVNLSFEHLFAILPHLLQTCRKWNWYHASISSLLLYCDNHLSILPILLVQ